MSERLTCPQCGYSEILETDAWHPASEPPTPEDFEPTGHVLILTVEGLPDVATEMYCGNANITHWRRITPPK